MNKWKKERIKERKNGSKKERKKEGINIRKKETEFQIERNEIIRNMTDMKDRTRQVDIFTQKFSFKTQDYFQKW